MQSILSSRLISGRDEFHRRLFELMLGMQWQRDAQSLPPAEAPVLLGVLSRWITEAPVRDELGVLRLLAARGVLRTLTRATGTPLGAFLAKVLGLDQDQLLHPERLPDWKQAKLAALGDASVLTVDALAAWNAAQPLWARLAAIAALDACPLQEDMARTTAGIGHWLSSQPPADLPAHLLEALKVSAFHVSYLADSGRHAFKRAIVRQAAHMVRKQLRMPPPSQARRDAAPIRLTIVGELLFPQHAMFRCYAELLAGLKEHFHVTLLADEPTRCAGHGQFSHEQRYFAPHERDLVKLAGLVASTSPDIILYPSIGMTYWTFALSLLRLAPLQLMSVGHPAPSCSDEIDGTLVYRELAATAQPEYGRLLTYDMQPLPAPPPVGWGAGSAASGRQALISINAASMKLTPAFLATVAKVLEAAPADTQLQFFPNVGGIALQALRRDLQSLFPQALVHPPAEYAAYMETLGRSDLILQSFPFGGTNTAMDALALGIPMVCLEGDDLSAAVDPVLLRRAGLGALCASSPDDYVALARGLLASSEERERIRQLSRAALPLLASQPPLGPRTIADAIREAWDSRVEA